MIKSIMALSLLVASTSVFAAPTSEEFKAQLLSHEWCGKAVSGDAVHVQFSVQDSFMFQADAGSNVQIDELKLNGGTAQATWSSTNFTYVDASNILFVSDFIFPGEKLALGSCK